MKRMSLACGLILILANNLLAAIVFDSAGFEAYNPGILVGQTGGGTIPWTDFNPPTSGNRFLVQSAVTNGGSRAISVTSTSQVPAFVAPALNFTPTSGETVIIEVDIARTISGSPALPTSNGFAIDVYDPAGTRTLGFGLGVNANNTAIVPFLTRFNGTPDGVSDTINLAVASNQFVRFRVELNYATDRFQLFANDINVGGIHQFVNAASALGDADLQHDPVVGAADIGYFDNYRISTVPEPGSTIGCVAFLLGLMQRRRQNV